MTAKLMDAWSQTFPPKPEFTEKQIPDLSGKVYIITGASSGVGKELARILYSKNARVYVAARSEAKAQAAIDSIKASLPHSTGDLIYLFLDLSDLTTIKPTVDAFLAKEKEIHVLFNNAGVMTPPQGSKTAQGYELQLGTNNLGTFLLTKLLTPTMVSTAKSSPQGAVRVVWVSSAATEFAPSGGLVIENLDYRIDKSAGEKYAISKVGNFLHAVEFAKRHGADSDGIISIALHPGNLTTDLTRHWGWLQQKLVATLIMYPPVFGAYTELFAGLSDRVTTESVKTTNWVIPWGRFGSIRDDIGIAARPQSEGGAGLAERFWQWTEDQVKPFM